MFRKTWPCLGWGLAVSSAVLLSSSAASAFTRTLNFCNKMSVNVEVAYGYEPAGSVNTQTKGWRVVQSCQCVTLFTEDVRATEMYVYVQRTGSGDALTDGAASLCVRDKKFQVGPSNKSEKRCKDTGGRWVKFQQVNAEKGTHILNFGSGAKCRG